MLFVGIVCANPNPQPVRAQQPAKAAPAKLQYNRDVRPILAENCFACHGPDSASRKAGLRLDQREAAVDKGAIEPGKPMDSELLVRVLLKDTDDQLMPPMKSHKKLTVAQKDTLKRGSLRVRNTNRIGRLSRRRKPRCPN